MIFRQLFDSASCTYTYLLADPESRGCVLIDPVYEHHERDVALMRELDLKLTMTLETHVHADHITGAWLLKDRLDSKIALSKAARAEGVDVQLQDGDPIKVGALALTAHATPGHTDGCMTYVLADGSMAFTGDALLIRGAGRTDFQQGNARSLYRSIKDKILTLNDDCLLYPGHDYQGRTVTTVNEEKEHNPRFGGLANEDDFVGFMENLGLAHPKKLDVAVPANMKCGRPEGAHVSRADWAPLVRSYAGIPEISPAWVAEHRAEVCILDVREPDELEGVLGKAAGILAVPLGELRQRLDEIPKDKPVCVVCRSGRRSAQACSILEKDGRARVANVTGGMIRWRELGLC